jgi:hypothetical protein
MRTDPLYMLFYLVVFIILVVVLFKILGIAFH